VSIFTAAQIAAAVKFMNNYVNPRQVATPFHQLTNGAETTVPQALIVTVP
jgi:hypothetical protein